MGARNLLALVALVGAGALACSQVVGLEDRTLDPTFGAGGGGADAGADAQAESGGDAAIALDCPTYCDAVGSGCDATDKQYETGKVCLDVCARIPVGTADNPTGNTLACRIDAAVKALNTGEPSLTCASAGPAGGSPTPDGGAACGTNCDAFCLLVQKVCPAQFGEQWLDNRDACLAECATFPDKGSYTTAIKSGNSVQCRVYHANAATQDSVMHCPHTIGLAGTAPKPPCTD